MKKVFGMKPGDVFGVWKIISTEDACQENRYLIKVQCACGKIVLRQGCHIKYGASKSCGCVTSELSKKHSDIGMEEYEVWRTARQSGKTTLEYREFIETFGKKQNKNDVFFLNSWINRGLVNAISQYGYCEHIKITAAYYCGLYGYAESSKRTGVKETAIQNYPAKFKFAYSQGKAERARRHQAARAPKHAPAVVNTAVDF